MSSVSHSGHCTFISLLSFCTTIAFAAPPGEAHDNSRRQATFVPTGTDEDRAALPLTIGGILGSYAFTLLLVGAILLALGKKRRARLRGADEVASYGTPRFQFPAPPPFVAQDSSEAPLAQYPSEISIQKEHSHIRNFSLPSPTAVGYYPSYENPSLVFSTSPPRSIASYPGVAAEVDQSIVERDRVMAQNQLEEMYRHVMDQEDAKEMGVRYQPSVAPAGMVFNDPMAAPYQNRPVSKLSRKERNKPNDLNLSGEPTAERQSKASSFMTALKSPLMRTKKNQAVSISSPIMTPMSGTFPAHLQEQEMAPLSPRHYIQPMHLPPVPSRTASYAPSVASNAPSHVSAVPRRFPAAPITPPDHSPESTQSIDERLKAMSMQDPTEPKIAEHPEEDEEKTEEEAAAARKQTPAPASDLPFRQFEQQPSGTAAPQLHTRDLSAASTIHETVLPSATSQTPLVGLPLSPRPGARFPSQTSLPSLPASPKPGATFSRANAPSAVRTNGTLPLRAYEPALLSPNSYDRTVKQTTFERSMPMSPGGMHTARTPGTAGPAVPYTPYQPFSPVFPMTPSLVTKADRKRMKRFEPKTPTMTMVQNEDDVW